jgi:hypothetical protein
MCCTIQIKTHNSQKQKKETAGAGTDTSTEKNAGKLFYRQAISHLKVSYFQPGNSLFRKVLGRHTAQLLCISEKASP